MSGGISSSILISLAATNPPDNSQDAARDAETRARIEAEQAALPYKWTQSIADCDISFTVPAELTGKNISVDIKKTKLTAGIKGQEPVISVGLCP